MAASSPERSAVALLSDDAAYLLLERLRWGVGAPTCPHCGYVGRTYLLRPVDGVARRTRTGAPTARRVWKCGSCRRQFSVLTGTVLQGTRVPLPAWIAALTVLTGDGPVTSATVSGASGLGREAARHVIARWHAACEFEPLRALTGSAPQRQG